MVTRRHHVSAAHSKSLGELVQRIDADVSRPFGSPPRASPLGVRGRSSPWGSLIHIEAASVSGDLASASAPSAAVRRPERILLDGAPSNPTRPPLRVVLPPPPAEGRVGLGSGRRRHRGSFGHKEFGLRALNEKAGVNPQGALGGNQRPEVRASLGGDRWNEGLVRRQVSYRLSELCDDGISDASIAIASPRAHPRSALATANAALSRKAYKSAGIILPPCGWRPAIRSVATICRPETLRTAIATAFFWPTSTTSRFPRVCGCPSSGLFIHRRGDHRTSVLAPLSWTANLLADQHHGASAPGRGSRGSQWTPRWREADSNCRSRSRERICGVPTKST